MFVCEIDQLYNLALFEYIISVSIIDSTIINRSIVCSEKQQNPKLINFYQFSATGFTTRSDIGPARDATDVP